MDIQKNKSFKPVGIALLAGSLATGIQASLLPSEAKIAIKNTIFGQDYYVRRAKEAADETMLFSGKKCNINNVIKCAKSKFPVVDYIAKNSLRKLANTFAIVTGSILLVSATKSIIEKIKTLKKQENPIV